MPGEKRFRTSFLGGFKKSDVNSYIEQLVEQHSAEVKANEKEIENLKNQCKEYRLKYEELLNKSSQIEEDRAKIADVLIKAQEKAERMVEDARIEALEEKKKLEDTIEREREKLVDIRQQIKTLKSEFVSALKRYDSQLGSFIDESEGEDEANEAS
jgi:cell division initiation protein